MIQVFFCLFLFVFAGYGVYLKPAQYGKSTILEKQQENDNVLSILYVQHVSLSQGRETMHPKSYKTGYGQWLHLVTVGCVDTDPSVSFCLFQ